MVHNNDPDLELHFSLGEVKSTLGEIRERLDDIHMGEVHYRHSGNTLLVLVVCYNTFLNTFLTQSVLLPLPDLLHTCVGIS